VRTPRRERLVEKWVERTRSCGHCVMTVSYRRQQFPGALGRSREALLKDVADRTQRADVLDPWIGHRPSPLGFRENLTSESSTPLFD